MGNDEGVCRRAPSGRRGWREQPGARREPDERQTWMRWSEKNRTMEGKFRRTPTWCAKCWISGSGRPLRFEHWGAHGDLSPTDLRPISSRDLSWKQRTTQGTQGLYWFGPPLWCNILLQCVVWWIASGANDERYNGRTILRGEEFLCWWCLLGRIESGSLSTMVASPIYRARP